MENVNRSTEYEASFNIGSNADIVLGVHQAWFSLIHDWGQIIVDHELAINDGIGEYSYAFSEDELKSSGIHKILFEYTQIGADHIKTEYIEVIQRYSDSDDFASDYPEINETLLENYDKYEAIARRIIDTFCWQNFQYYDNMTLTYDGTGTKELALNRRLDSFSDTTLDSEEINVQFIPEDDQKRYLRYEKVGDSWTGYPRTKFTLDSTIEITGCWGWPYIPENINLASKMLIYDLMLDTRINYTHGVEQMWMDTQRTVFKQELFETTGNIDVDNLLLDYTIWEPSYV